MISIERQRIGIEKQRAKRHLDHSLCLINDYMLYSCGIAHLNLSEDNAQKLLLENYKTILDGYNSLLRQKAVYDILMGKKAFYAHDSLDMRLLSRNIGDFLTRVEEDLKKGDYNDSLNVLSLFNMRLTRHSEVLMQDGRQ